MINSSWLVEKALFLVLSTVSSVLPVKIETISGESIEADWIRVTDKGLELGNHPSIHSLPFEKIASLEPTAAPTKPNPPPFTVTLNGGSMVAAQDLTLDGSDLTFEPRRQPPIVAKLDSIHSVRFRNGSPSSDPEWLGLTENRGRRDIMVIRRDAGKLDPIDVVITGLNATVLNVELEGEKIEAPLDRLEGIVLRETGENVPRASVQIEDRYGSKFAALRLEPSDSPGSITLLLGDGVRHVLPMDQIVSVRWSSGQVMLASLVAASKSSKPLLKTNLSSELFNDWFSPAHEGNDIVAAAGGTIEYRVEKGFQTLAGSVRRHELARKSGDVSIRISADDKVLWEEKLSGDESKGFQLPINARSRVRIETSAGEDGDVGDLVRFSKPRFLK